ncbi:TBC1 domain family member 31 [Bienertia sinuspersici]
MGGDDEALPTPFYWKNGNGGATIDGDGKEVPMEVKVERDFQCHGGCWCCCGAGKYQLNSTSGAKVHIKFETLEVLAFKECISHNAPHKIHQIQVDQSESLEEAVNEAYTYNAKITKVLDHDCGWTYSSCNTCKSKLDHNQHCNKHNQTSLFPKNRYITKTRHNSTNNILSTQMHVPNCSHN